MRDVAALAGVSIKTVSRVVNQEAGVSEDLVERVQDAARQLDYRPDLTASNLRRGRQTANAIWGNAASVLVGDFLYSRSFQMMVTVDSMRVMEVLSNATNMIANGKFDHRPNIRNKDELGDLARSFVTMAQRLKQLEEMYLDTSPLTRLPGGIAIENVMKKRIAANVPIAFCLMDIDNFKAYNDHYGYAKGNDIIQATAAIISEAVAKFGTEDDFIGHIGGDDYVLITTPDLYPRVCQSVIDHFDRTIPSFYDEADRKRGHIVSENRQGQEVKFPLASLSIAVVTNVKRKFKNHIQFGEVAAEMKELAKTVAGSTYMVDQRGDDSPKGKKDRKLISLQSAKRGTKG